MLKKATVLTRPTPARRDAPFRGQDRSERDEIRLRSRLRLSKVPTFCTQPQP